MLENHDEWHSPKMEITLSVDELSDQNDSNRTTVIHPGDHESLRIDKEAEQQKDTCESWGRKTAMTKETCLTFVTTMILLYIHSGKLCECEKFSQHSYIVVVV